LCSLHHCHVHEYGYAIELGLISGETIHRRFGEPRLKPWQEQIDAPDIDGAHSG
jgi:hypothetical protein